MNKQIVVSGAPGFVDLNAVLRKPVERQPVPIDVINQIFKVLHGAYGQLFLSKFATGQLDDQGKDKGIASTRQVWAHGLRGMDAATITDALERVLDAHPEFPPSLPQFIALCKAAKPPQRPEELVRLGSSGEAHANATKEAREAAMAKIKRQRAVAQPESGLSLLSSLVAAAVAAAGGDEVAELRRLDLMFSKSQGDAQ